jgi:hypothetical protein
MLSQTSPRWFPSGFLDDVELALRTRTASGNYHGQTNAESIEKWTKEKVKLAVFGVVTPCSLVEVS